MIISESGYCVRVGRHVYPQTVVSVCYHYKNISKRVGLVQKGTSSSSHWKSTCWRHDIAAALPSWRQATITNSLTQIIINNIFIKMCTIQGSSHTVHLSSKIV